MPTYKYRCNKCGHEFEKRQRMSDKPLSECPVCGGDVRRVVGSVGIVFKGSGFYVTDNRSSNGKGRVQTTEKSSDSADQAIEKSNGKSQEKKSKEDKSSKSDKDSD
ncbi:MAG: FmdB family zinc ribbon protein [Candidatus Promineifilaceae bacterium]|nr:FmdB family zinc ribbon protein [Candidatus Promineifilaceae bacterium]